MRPAILDPAAPTRPRLAVWKFSSCDGCQLSLLDCERELLTIAGRVSFAYFAELSSDLQDGPYDLSLVEGSISTPDDLERIQRIRRDSKLIVSIGACATSGGIQALRNLADVEEYGRIVYPRPEEVATLATATPISDHIEVDAELRGCPIDRAQLVEFITAYVDRRPAQIASNSVCTECKASGTPCVMVAAGTPCLGPVTHSGCGALCPRVHRGCYGCFGPAETANTASLDQWFAALGMDAAERERFWRGISGWAPEFRDAADAVAGTSDDRER